MAQGQAKLAASARSVIGKAVRRLRREGIVPGNMSGLGSSSTAVQVDAKELDAIISRVGTNALVTLTLDGGERSVLIRGVSRDPLRGSPVHVDLEEVALDQAIKAPVQIVLVGEAPAAKGNNVVLRLVDHVTVQGLPADLPPSIHVDITDMTEPNQTLYVRDLVLPEGVLVLDDPDEPVAKIAESRVAREDLEEAEAAAEAAEAAEMAPPTGEAETPGEDEQA